LEFEKSIDNVKIKYMYKPRKYDSTHLLIVFSGFGGTDEFTYDFSNSLKDCPSHVIWIKDDFEEHCCYYLCQSMNFKIENAIYTFILDKLKEFNLDKNQCTLAGFSKGGSAALYFGLKYNFDNIISSVPQFHIGSYVKKGWNEVAKHMMGDLSQENICTLNDLLPDTLRKDTNLLKNIYLLTSESDSQFLTEVKPYLSEFIKYNNFNLLLSKSKLVREHKNVTAHHVPLLISLFYSLAQGAVPRYGYVELTGDNKDKPENPTAEPISILKKISIQSNLIFPEGVGILRGLSCGEYSDISSKLICDGLNGRFEWNLAKDHIPRLTRDLYEGGFVNYDKGWFCSYRYQGLDTSHLPAGEYTLSVIITCQGITKNNLLSVDQRLWNKEIATSPQLKIVAKEGLVHLIKS